MKPPTRDSGPGVGGFTTGRFDALVELVDVDYDPIYSDYDLSEYDLDIPMLVDQHLSLTHT